MKIDSVFNKINKTSEDSPTITSGKELSDVAPTSLGSAISLKESGGDYTATNPNSSAAGKYQFLWNTWKKQINDVTGINSKQDFLDRPQQQERFYSWYEQHHLKPEADKLRASGKGSHLTDTQLAKLVHYRGSKGAERWLDGKLSDKPESYNMPISKYIFAYGGILPHKDMGGFIKKNSDAIGSVGTMFGDLASQDESTEGQAVGGALKGASVGLALGPIGAAVGGVVGLASGLLNAQKAKQQKNLLADQKRTAINQQLSQFSKQNWAMNADTPQLASYFALGGEIAPLAIRGLDSKDNLGRNRRRGERLSEYPMDRAGIETPMIPRTTGKNVADVGQVAEDATARGADYTRKWLNGKGYGAGSVYIDTPRALRNNDYDKLTGINSQYADGVYDPNKDRAYVATDGMTPEAIASTATHESMHQVQNHFSNNDEMIASMDKLKSRTRSDNPYLSNPQEQQSEIMQMRAGIDQDPNKKFNRMKWRAMRFGNMFTGKHNAEIDAFKRVKVAQGRSNTFLSVNDTFALGGNLPNFAYGGITPQWEAEKDEVVQGNDTQLEDGKQLASDIHHVGGNTHEKGGTLGSGGDRVFSNRIPLHSHTADALKQLGIKASGTIAETASKIGKLKGKMEEKLTSRNTATRTTGELMSQRYDSALNILFDHQEEMKMPMFALGGTLPGPGPKKKPLADKDDPYRKPINGNLLDEVKVHPQIQNDGYDIIRPMAKTKVQVGTKPQLAAAGDVSARTGTGNKSLLDDVVGDIRSDKTSKLEEALPMISTVFAGLSASNTANKIKTRPDVNLVKTPGYNYQDRSQGTLRDINEQYQSTVLPDRLKGQAFVDKLKMRGEAMNQENQRRDQYNNQYNQQALTANAINAQATNRANDMELNNTNVKTQLQGEVAQGTLQNLNTIAAEKQKKKLDLKKIALIAESYKFGRTADLGQTEATKKILEMSGYKSPLETK